MRLDLRKASGLAKEPLATSELTEREEYLGGSADQRHAVATLAGEEFRPLDATSRPVDLLASYRSLCLNEQPLDRLIIETVRGPQPRQVPKGGVEQHPHGAARCAAAPVSLLGGSYPGARVAELANERRGDGSRLIQLRCVERLIGWVGKRQLVILLCPAVSTLLAQPCGGCPGRDRRPLQLTRRRPMPRHAGRLAALGFGEGGEAAVQARLLDWAQRRNDGLGDQGVAQAKQPVSLNGEPGGGERAEGGIEFEFIDESACCLGRQRLAGNRKDAGQHLRCRGQRLELGGDRLNDSPREPIPATEQLLGPERVSACARVQVTWRVPAHCRRHPPDRTGRQRPKLQLMDTRRADQPSKCPQRGV